MALTRKDDVSLFCQATFNLFQTISLCLRRSYPLMLLRSFQIATARTRSVEILWQLIQRLHLFDVLRAAVSLVI